jgi:hypothetical protein
MKNDGFVMKEKMKAFIVIVSHESVLLQKQPEGNWGLPNVEVDSVASESEIMNILDQGLRKICFRLNIPPDSKGDKMLLFSFEGEEVVMVNLQYSDLLFSGDYGKIVFQESIRNKKLGYFSGGMFASIVSPLEQSLIEEALRLKEAKRSCHRPLFCFFKNVD